MLEFGNDIWFSFETSRLKIFTRLTYVRAHTTNTGGKVSKGAKILFPRDSQSPPAISSEQEKKGEVEGVA